MLLAYHATCFWPILSDSVTPTRRLGGPDLLVNAYRKHGIAALEECTMEGRPRGRKSKGASKPQPALDRQLVWSQSTAMDAATLPGPSSVPTVAAPETTPEMPADTAEHSAAGPSGAMPVCCYAVWTDHAAPLKPQNRSPALVLLVFDGGGACLVWVVMLQHGMSRPQVPVCHFHPVSYTHLTLPTKA